MTSLEDLADHILRYWPKDSQEQERAGVRTLITRGMEAALNQARDQVSNLVTDPAGDFIPRDEVLAILSPPARP